MVEGSGPVRRLVAVGMSHVGALREAAERGLLGDATRLDAVPLVGRDDCRPFVTDGALHPVLAAELDRLVLDDPPDLLVLALAGNAHNTLTLVAHPQPFGIAGSDPDAEQVPSAVIADTIRTRDAAAHRVLLAIAQRYDGVPMVVPAPPPPIPPELPRSAAPPFEALADHERSPLALRIAAWRLAADTMADLATRAGATYLPPPPESVRTDGALRADLVHNETHADAEYGRLVVAQCLDLLDPAPDPTVEEPMTADTDHSTRDPADPEGVAEPTLADVESWVRIADRLHQHRQNNSIRNLPNFVGVGAGRCATTSIYDYLRAHPSAYLSPVKEVNYFGVRDEEHNPFGFDLEQYAGYFTGASGEPIIGEISPVYLTMPGSRTRMAADLGTDISILVTVRDPVERGVSQYHSHFAFHDWDDIDAYFADGLRIVADQDPASYERDWFSPALSLTQSAYGTALGRWRTTFGKERVHVIVFEDLMRDPPNELAGLCAFLGIPYEDIPFGMSDPIPGAKARKQRPSPETVEALRAHHMVEVQMLGALLGRDLLTDWGWR